ncbi:MAG: HAMP domain-containing histidine kinase [Polyangiaceae bacterium]|nr:HAMP domain-containing histidine kinase [Polyangiaceae bacterium]
MALRGLLSSRLAVRIYLVGLAQFAVVAAGFAALLIANRPPRMSFFDRDARFFVWHIEPMLGDPRAVEQELRRIRDDFGVAAAVIDSTGAVVATNAGRAPLCPPPGPRPPGPPPPGARGFHPICVTTPVQLPDGRAGRIEVVLEGPPPPPPPFMGVGVVPLVLLVVGVSSWLLARTLTRPLRKLSNAARAFGAGDLAARAEVSRRDELGEVGHAFDEMAERVTDLFRAEKELLANVSHELRTPLARVRVALDLASEGNAEVARESLAEISEDLDELERLISDVLMAARLDLGGTSVPSGVPPLRRERVELSELLLRAAARFQAAHPDRALHMDVPGELPPVEADPVLLRRVVENLLENAHKYTDRTAEPVKLRARAVDGGEGVEIEVIDKGIGIAAADLPMIFRPFFRADKSRTRATGGLGLGLTLAKRIVDAHGGTLELESAPGEGTRARVRLRAGAGLTRRGG